MNLGVYARKYIFISFGHDYPHNDNQQIYFYSIITQKWEEKFIIHTSNYSKNLNGAGVILFGVHLLQQTHLKRFFQTQHSFLHVRPTPEIRESAITARILCSPTRHR